MMTTTLIITEVVSLMFLIKNGYYVIISKKGGTFTTHAWKDGIVCHLNFLTKNESLNAGDDLKFSQVTRQ